MLDNITVTKILEVFTVLSEKKRFEKIENRKCFGLSFGYEGQITYSHNGKKVISDKNNAVILPKGQNYTLYGDKSGRFPVINFMCAENICDTIISLPISNSDAYIKDFEKLKSLSLFEGNNLEMMSVFYHMMHRLSSQNAPHKVIVPAVKYIEKNYSDPNLTNEELAGQCNISEVYFRKMFTRHYKMTPKQFIIDVRINKAKQLLCEGAYKINTVAAQCGFSNQYHFCRIFKEKTGITPTEYMRQNKIYGI